MCTHTECILQVDSWNWWWQYTSAVAVALLSLASTRAWAARWRMSDFFVVFLLFQTVPCLLWATVALPSCDICNYNDTLWPDWQTHTHKHTHADVDWQQAETSASVRRRADLNSNTLRNCLQTTRTATTTTITTATTASIALSTQHEKQTVSVCVCAVCVGPLKPCRKHLKEPTSEM